MRLITVIFMYMVYFNFLIGAFSLLPPTGLALQTIGATMAHCAPDNTKIISNTLPFSQQYGGRILMASGGVLFLLSHPDSLEAGILGRQALHMGFIFSTLKIAHHLYNFHDLSPMKKNILTGTAPFLVATLTQKPIILNFLWETIYKPLLNVGK